LSLVIKVCQFPSQRIDEVNRSIVTLSQSFTLRDNFSQNLESVTFAAGKRKLDSLRRD